MKSSYAKATKDKGKFIVFEGIDGAGSTTQADLLFEYFRSKGKKVVKTCEPTDGPIGKLIRKALRGEVKFSWEALQLMYSADRADHLDKLIGPSIKLGKTVISDRYYFSTYAYGELNLDRKWLRGLSPNFPMPDVTFLVDVPVSMAMDRIKTSRGKKELFEKQKFLEKVRKNYLDLAKEFKFVVLDGTRKKEEITKDVVRALDE